MHGKLIHLSDLQAYVALLISDPGFTMNPPTLYDRELDVLYRVIGIICQTFVFGIYACLFPLSTYIMIKKGMQTHLQKFLFGMTIFMFSLSSLVWIATIVDLIRSFKTWLLESRIGDEVLPIFPLFNALALINYLLTDGIVIWRAWVLCRDDSRKALSVPLFFLFVTAVAVLATIIIRVILTAADYSHSSLDRKRLSRAIDVAQVATLAMSLLTNVASTLIISWKAWHYRHSIQSDLDNTTERKKKVGKIMLLLIESGVLYCISCVITLIGAPIRLPALTVGDIYSPMNVQIAGLYPIIVLLLVDLEQSYGKTIFRNIEAGAGGENLQLETMQFRIYGHESVPENVDLHSRGR